MLKNITLHNVGPSAEMSLNLGERLTVITGDNGLGKSFLLDVAWWALTRKWPAEVNPGLTSGSKALPRNHVAFQAERNGGGTPLASTLAFTVQSRTKEVSYVSNFEYQDQAWSGRPGRPLNAGLVIYAMSDGSFALWDPARNYWRTTPDGDIQDRPSAYVFSPSEVWHGLLSADGKSALCNGLIRDWATWQREQGEDYQRLVQVLSSLSTPTLEELMPGPLTRVSLDDVRDMPTIKMPYGQSVPVVNVSSAMKRMVALAYFLSWAWAEHLKASSILQQSPTPQIIMLVDEVEAHLHPKWQRQVVPALLGVVKALSGDTQTQAIVTTHSPLVMASLEPIFDRDRDRWVDLDYVSNDQGQVEAVLTEREFVRMGDASDWLTSEAFDLESARSIEAADALEKAALAMSNPSFNGEDAKAIHAELAKVLGATDPFWARWRFVAERKGWPL